MLVKSVTSGHADLLLSVLASSLGRICPRGTWYGKRGSGEGSRRTSTRALNLSGGKGVEVTLVCESTNIRGS